MERFKNILIVVNDNSSETDNLAFNEGLELIRKNNGRLTLLSVVNPPASLISHYKGIFKKEELTAMLVSEREKNLVKIAEHSGEHLDIHTKVVVGKDFIEIVRQVVLGEHDLLIKIANEQNGSFDSRDFHLMRKCPQPVWLLKPKCHIEPKKVLAAIDLSLEGNQEGKTLNALIMDLATSLSKWKNNELHVLSCWSLYGENSLRHSAFLRISDDQLANLLTEEQQANRNLQQALTDKYPGFDIHAHLIKGDPIEHIPAFAREQAIDIVVMGTVARSGIPGLLIGNTAETILQSIDSSVITLKPNGFESIIQ